MRKILVGALSLVLSASCLFGATACSGGNPGSNENPKIEIGNKPTQDESAWKETPVSVPDYKHTDAVLYQDGHTDYAIVIAEDASTKTYTAASELNYFIELSSGIAFPIVTDSSVTWSASANFISIGENALSVNACITVSGLCDHGFAVKTVGNTLFLQGATSTGDIFAVYDILTKILGYDYYCADEIAIAKTDRLLLPEFDYTDEPDIEYRASQIGYQNGQISTRYRTVSAKFMSPEGVSNWHNSLGYIPYSTYGAEHPDWFATDLKGLCLTARDRSGGEYRELVATVAEKMESAIENNPDGDTIAFTHMDVGTWCTCEACTALKDKYGTDSASMILFMNDVVDLVETWREQAYPDRDNIRYVFFAYTATVQAPVKVDGGNIVAFDEQVQPREKVGVMYAPISSDFMHGKNEEQNSSYLRQMQEWHALVGDNVYYWFYQSYFYNYFLFYNNFESMQDNYRAAVDNGAVWMYDQSQYDNAASTGFQMLKVYLSSKLMWDVDADVAKLTEGFFDRYFKAASGTMYDLFTSIRLNYLWMAESLGVSGWIGTRINTSEYFKLNTLLEWEKLIEKAYEDIESLKISDYDSYQKVYNRINLESLSVRYLLIDLYGTQIYSTQELFEQKQQFKQDCSKLNVTRTSEGGLITKLWSEWGI